MVKISIIMPVYNDESNLEKSISSVFNQTLDDIELICVDDGSTDNSLNILHSFAKKDNRIRIFSQENKGSGSARNKGISQAHGEYIAFLDSDDYIVDDNAYFQLYAEAKKRNMIMASGSMQFVNSGNISYEFKSFKRISELNLKKVEDYGILWYFYKNIFRRDFIINNNIKFPDLRRGQDPVFLCECLSRIDHFLEVPIIYYAYNTPSEDKLNNSLKYHDYFLHFFNVFKILMPQKKFNKLVIEYSKILISMKNRDALVFNKQEIMNLLKIMDGIKKLFVSFGDESLVNEVVSSFNEIINKINIRNIEILINKNQNLDDNYSESIIVKDKSHKPLISLIMHVFNIEKFLPKCFESLLNQSLSDFEIICIDDGSSDNSLNVLEIYGKNDSRINILSCIHKGINNSFNQGIVRARGECIVFINPKNSFETDFCEKIYQYNAHQIELKLSDKIQNNDGPKIAKIKELEYFIVKYQEYLQIKDNHIEMIHENIDVIKQDNDYYKKMNDQLKHDNRSIKRENDQLKHDNRSIKRKNYIINEYVNDLKSNLETLNYQVHNQEKEIHEKDFMMKQLEIKINNKKIESQYFKRYGLFKRIIHPLSYLYILFKSGVSEIFINVKLFYNLNNNPYFDIGFYLSKYPELKDTFCCRYFSPELHYVCFGFNEHKQFNNNFICNSKTELYNKIHKKNQKK